MNNPNLIKTLIAEGTLTKFRLVTFGTADSQVAQASAVTDAPAGVLGNMVAADGKRVDVIKTGVVEVEYGGNVSAGDPLTTDADGKAVAASPATGVNNRIWGEAVVDGVDGDIGSIHLSFSTLQGE